MKIAVPSDDTQNISAHFGRCTYFIIYTVRDKKVIEREVRNNNYCPHRMGVCPKMVKSKKDKFVEKVRASAVGGIRDCNLLIGRFINPTLKSTLKKYNIDYRVVDEKEGDKTVEKYLSGALTDRSADFSCEHPQCQCNCLGEFIADN
ncbi:MAG: hypothetical protein HY811_07590 [Planctomycetes bacterium]|nr:hypothetical protein [Planctomycetota bacterium]